MSTSRNTKRNFDYALVQADPLPADLRHAIEHNGSIAIDDIGETAPDTDLGIIGAPAKTVRELRARPNNWRNLYAYR
jgi:hypothetical protein